MEPVKHGPKPARLEVIGVTGIGEVHRGDDLAGILLEALGEMDEVLRPGDVVVVTQKVVSKAEGAMAQLDGDDPRSHKPLVEREAVRVLRRRGDLLLTETRHGFVCANAGVDLSNVERGQAALLPEDPDRSARRMADALQGRTGTRVGIVVTDTFGRPWRRGVTDVAIGCAGLRAVVDLRGSTDALGRELQVTEVAVADEVAAAADLVMGKADAVPMALVRGLADSCFPEPDEKVGIVSDLVRHPSEDLFR